MASRYDENTKARAVRLVREHGGDYETEWAAMKAISARLGMSAETLRKWLRRAEVDARRRDRITQMRSHERHHQPSHLQVRHIAGQVDPIQTLHIEVHMPVAHLVHRHRRSDIRQTSPNLGGQRRSLTGRQFPKRPTPSGSLRRYRYGLRPSPRIAVGEPIEHPTNPAAPDAPMRAVVDGLDESAKPATNVEVTFRFEWHGHLTMPVKRRSPARGDSVLAAVGSEPPQLGFKFKRSRP